MSYTLLIVESPAKCQKIEKYLGTSYRVIGSFGHITTLSGLKQIDFDNNYKPTFEVIDSKKQQISRIRHMIKDAKEVILASDDDREGEAIAWHICQVFKLDVHTTKRIIFHEITEKAIKDALKSPGIINLNLVYAQQGRQILDLIVGFTITPILWSHIVSDVNKSLSAGRCQSPGLRLVYDNYRDIRESPGKLSYNVVGLFTSKNIPFVLNHLYESADDVKAFLHQTKTGPHALMREAERETVKAPPEPFTTSGLQQAANNQMHISPKETMELAQKLYEGGYITYMRTDSKVYCEEFMGKGEAFIVAKYGVTFVNKEFMAKKEEAKDEEQTKENEEAKECKKDKKGKKDKEDDEAKEAKKGKKGKKGKKDKDKEEEPNLAQEAHEAIRPTNIDVETIPEHEDVFTARHRKLYRLIWTNTVESMMAPAVYNQLVAKISAPALVHALVPALVPALAPALVVPPIKDSNKKTKDKDIFYKYVAEQPVFLGWKIVKGIKERGLEEEQGEGEEGQEGLETDKYYAFLKTLKEGPIAYNKILCKQTLKELKAHYTEAKLVQLLEKKGIGRPSTFSSLIEKITERGYVKRQNIEGRKFDIIDYELEKGIDKIKEIKQTKEFGNEKNKLVISQTGILVIEFLIANFDDLFKYDYTKMMENDLDKIAKGLKPYHELCDECHKFIQLLIEQNGLSTKENHKGFKIQIDDKHTYLIGKNGPTVKYTKEDGTTGFYGVKEDIDVDKLKRGEYMIEEIIVTAEDKRRLLGSYKENEVWLKTGKFGLYLECGQVKKSLSTVAINVPHWNIELPDAIKILETAEKADNSIVRRIDDTISIRKGQYGEYIFYKTEKMRRPIFYRLAGFVGDYRTCDIKDIKAFIDLK